MQATIPRRPLHWFLRELRIGVPVAFGAALFFSTLYREQFGTNLIYSICITALIQALIQGGRYGMLRLGVQSERAPGGRAWPDYRLMFPWVLVSGVLGYFGGSAVAGWLTGSYGSPAELARNPRALALSTTVVMALAAAISYFFYTRGRMAAMAAREQAALRSAAENQLRLLESQLEPHMLFNTLGNLRALIGQDPQRAQHMLNQLIAFLRATLEASRSGPHPLSSEFARVADYLGLMEVRMGERLRTELDLPPELAGLPVPPLLLQPLVENAIKHGLEPKLAGGVIRLAARRDGNVLVLTVRDTGMGLRVSPLAPPKDATCFGTAQVRERLAQLFGTQASFTLDKAGDADGGTLATVRIPLS
ncbi:sensor histidine kinase [Cupriavidus sp. 2TAF22]|uniref:sensor histidine kinase n=1 Tax=unclassified Cupriavidus TaxID=2640874 RepID=UPI003F8E4F32